jgi:hypothetical protein
MKKDKIHFDGLPYGEDLENKAICDNWDYNINIDFHFSSYLWSHSITIIACLEVSFHFVK